MASYSDLAVINSSLSLMLFVAILATKVTLLTTHPPQPALNLLDLELEDFDPSIPVLTDTMHVRRYQATGHKDKKQWLRSLVPFIMGPGRFERFLAGTNLSTLDTFTGHLIIKISNISTADSNTPYSDPQFINTEHGSATLSKIQEFMGTPSGEDGVAVCEIKSLKFDEQTGKGSPTAAVHEWIGNLWFDMLQEDIMVEVKLLPGQDRGSWCMRETYGRAEEDQD